MGFRYYVVNIFYFIQPSPSALPTKEHKPFTSPGASSPTPTLKITNLFQIPGDSISLDLLNYTQMSLLS